MNGLDVVKALVKRGFYIKGQEGSHIQLENKEGNQVTVSLKGEIKKGTLLLIASKAGIEKSEFLALIEEAR